MKHDFRMIQNYPIPKESAPYVYIIIREAHATVDSIYRGDDARSLLNHYGHHSQYQLYHATPQQRIDWGISGQPNAPGFSTHELKSDGSANIANAYGVHRGGDLPWWGIGLDVLDQDADRCIRVARKYGWDLFRPYASGSEKHHLNFRHQPKPGKVWTWVRINKIRMTLPRN